MFEIKITLDATDALLSAVRDAVDACTGRRAPAIHEGVWQRLDAMRADGPVQRMPAEKPIVEPETHAESAEAEEPVEAPAEPEEPKKRKPRAKKQASQSEEPKEALTDEPTEAPKQEEEIIEEPKTADPEPKADEAVPEDAPKEEAIDLSGKGETGDNLAELTRKAIAELDNSGVSRADANRRLREYCASHDIKLPTFPALVQAVGYGTAIAVCMGEA